MQLFNKKQVLLGIILLPALSFAQQSFSINGTILRSNPSPDRVLISYTSQGQNYIDSAFVQNGTYNFSGTLAGPTRIELLAKYNRTYPPSMQRDIVALFIEPANVQVISRDSFSNAVVTGSAVNQDFKKLQSMAQPYVAKMQPLMQQYQQYEQNKDRANAGRVKKQIDARTEEMNDAIYPAFIRQNPNSGLGMFALNQYMGPILKDNKIAETQSLYNMLPLQTRESTEGKRVAQRLMLAKATAVGKQAPAFTQNDSLGNPVSLAQYRGNYILVNFWASWAANSRYNNPKLVSAYNAYHNKGFNVIGVSLDQPGGRNDWLNAVKKDKLPWVEVTDLKYWNNDVARLYGVTALPQNFLIDPNGKIVAKDLYGEELMQKLAEIYGN
ncbi:MAG: AhpC/TSA family protein [Chitinophagaceae bacterium]|jgi:peroxiredoxin|nr:AhpC/TSA family protein [Chitinophagaceae bacterium]